MITKSELRKRRKVRVRKGVSGSAKKPRISVYRSNKYIYVQAIDDENAITLASESDYRIKGDYKKIKKAEEVGLKLAKKLKTKKISKIVFDRGGYKYHGRVKMLAEGLRKGGINF